MSVRTRMRHIKTTEKSVEIHIMIDGKESHRYEVPFSKSETLLSDLRKYEEETINLDSTELYNRRLSKIRGDSRYQKSALIVKTARQKKGVTQKALAEMIGIDRVNLVHIEKARRPVGKEMAQKFSKVLDTDYRVFLSKKS